MLQHAVFILVFVLLQHVWLEEMTEGLFRGEGHEEEEEREEEEDTELPPFKRPVKAEDRKSKKQQRKAREMKEEVSDSLLVIRAQVHMTLI